MKIYSTHVFIIQVYYVKNIYIILVLYNNNEYYKRNNKAQVTIKQRNNECTVARMLVNKKKLFENRIFVRIPGHF